MKIAQRKPEELNPPTIHKIYQLTAKTGAGTPIVSLHTSYEGAVTKARRMGYSADPLAHKLILRRNDGSRLHPEPSVAQVEEINLETP